MYNYEPVGQVLTVQHPNGRETKYAYDLLGRKLMVNHPDAGEAEMTYDAAGNLLTKLTAEQRKSISAEGYISYTYDFERLHEVLYPENLFNRVTYTYGRQVTSITVQGGLHSWRMPRATKRITGLVEKRWVIYGSVENRWGFYRFIR